MPAALRYTDSAPAHVRFRKPSERLPPPSFLSQNRQTEVRVYAPDYLLEDDERFLGSQPKRAYIGMRYHGGYSDHLPIVLRLR